MRSFYISDKDNLIPGYDFYIVGAAEKVEVDNHKIREVIFFIIFLLYIFLAHNGCGQIFP